MSNNPVEPVPSATVVLLRDAESGLEVLLLRRNTRLAFAGGAWVFPGGAIAAAEISHGEIEQVARLAAVRETEEECSLQIDPDSLVFFSHWTTPETEPKRFATWFFCTQLKNTQAVEIDGGEIHGHQWTSPQQALAEHSAGQIALLMPTFLTLKLLCGFDSAETAISALRSIEPTPIMPVTYSEQGQVLLLLPGDAERSGNLEDSNARHRLSMTDSGWRYEHRCCAPEVARLDQIESLPKMA